jgi:uncharacterized protein YjdB
MKVRTSVLRGFALLALSSLTFAACDERAAVAPPPVIAVTVTPPSVSLLVGQTVTLIATVSGTTNQAVTWASTNTAVATVTAAGVVTAVAPGTAVITATSAADPTARSGAAVVVTAAPPPPPPTLSLIPATATVVAGSTLQLVAIVGNTTIMGVTYASSDTAVATVSAAGLVTARRAGTAVITGRTVATPVATATSTVTVTAAPPPPTPHITIAPTTATVQVGRTQTFVATVTGVANTAVLWRTSDAAVATITAAGIATGVSPGTAVITAISVADTTRRVDATLTVTPAPPVTQPAISIQSVTLVPGGGPVTPGQTLPNDASLNVVVNVAAGSEAPIGRVEIQLGAAPPAACVQTFTPPLASTQGVQVISCVVSTTQLDAAGRPRFPNGTYALSAVAFNHLGASVATASWGTVVLANLDRLTFPAPAVTTAAVDGTGSIFVSGVEWREGNVVVRARPVIFTPGLTVASVVICVQASDGPVVAAACRTVTTADTAGVYTTTFPKANAPGHATSPGVLGITTTNLQVYGSSTFTTGAAGPAVIVGTGPSIRLDNVGPTGAVGALPRTWLDAAFAFTAASIVTTAPTSEAPTGVSGPTPLAPFTYEFRWVPTAAWTATGATTATRWAAGTTVTTAAAIPPSDVSTAYHLIFRARDGLGNFGTFEVPGTFGVDHVAPTFTVVAGSPAPLTINPVTDFTFTFTDDRAGFDANPVQVRLTRWTSNPALRNCIDVNTGAVLAGAAGTADPCGWITLTLAGNVLPVPAAAGYYGVDISVLDRAGNRSTVDSRLVLRDGAHPVPTVTAFALSGNDVTINATITDNVAIRGFDHRVQFAGAAAPTGATTPTLPITGLQHVRTFGIDRVGSHAVVASITTWRSMLVTDAGGGTAAGIRTQASGVGIGAWDVARNFPLAEATGFVGVGQTGGVLPAGLANWNVALSGTTACNGWMPIPSGDGGPVCVTPTPPATRTVTATATGPTGTFENPFASVNFYAVYTDGSVLLLGTVPGAAAAVVEQLAPTVNRLYQWTFTFDATQRPGSATAYQIFAVGVQATRDVVRSPTAAITVQGAMRQPSTLTDRP